MLYDPEMRIPEIVTINDFTSLFQESKMIGDVSLEKAKEWGWSTEGTRNRKDP